MADAPTGPDRAAILGALAVGAWLRLGALGREGLWLDELFTVRVATRESWAAMIEDLARDVHPPAWFALLRLVVPPGAEDAAWRVPSALAGLVSIVAAAVLALRLGGRHAAVGAAWLVATAPGLVLLDREARGNGPMAALGLVVLAGIAGGGRARWLLALPAAALVNVHLFGAFALLGVGLWALADPAPATPRRTTLALCAAGAVALVPWGTVLAVQVSGFVASPWYTAPSADAVGWIVQELSDERPGLLALALLGVGLALREAPRAVLLLAAMIAALILVPQALSYAVAPMLRARSALLLLPVLLVVSAVGYGRAGRAGAALLGLAAAGQGLASWYVTREETRMEAWREAAAVVAAEGPPDLLIANHPQLWRRYVPEGPLLDAADPALDAAPGAWVLLGHDVEPPPALAALLDGVPLLRDDRLHGARVLRTGPLARPLAFTLPPGAPGRAEGTAVELWGAGTAVTAPLRVRGRCVVEVHATEDAAGTEPARLRVRLSGAEAWIDEELAVGPGPLRTVGRTAALDGDPGRADVHVSVAFVNDAVVDGKDRNVHIDGVLLRCE